MIDDSDENSKNNKPEEVWAKISHEVEVVCAKIFDLVNGILSAHSNFGFSAINQNINPSLDDIVKIMQVTEFALGTFASNAQDFSNQRQVDNAMQMIWCVKGLAIAIKSDQQDDYDAMIEKMRKQAQH